MNYIKITMAMALVTAVTGCDAQTEKKSMSAETGAVICDPIKGVCEMPLSSTNQTAVVEKAADGRVKLLYFTDPICSACWSMEPQLRKLLLDYGKYLQIEYRMGGLLPSWEVYRGGGISKPSDVAHHWEEMAHHFGMPISGGVWTKDPLNSSYPPCIAVKAAGMQSAARAEALLRKLREMVAMEEKNITKWEHIAAAATSCGLDTARLRADYIGRAQELFREDLTLAGQYGVRGFPALYFIDAKGRQANVYGCRPYADLENALRSLVPEAKAVAVETAGGKVFRHYSSLTTPEYAAIRGVASGAAEAELADLEKKGVIQRVQTVPGVLWRRK